MKTHTMLALGGLSLLAPSLFGETNTPPIPEAARKHFVTGSTLAKDAKTAADFSEVVSEFKQAVDLAPRLPEARYNLAKAREAAGDYSGAVADLKRYQQFKLSDTEARNVQDKIYALEAKTKKQAGEQKVAAERNSAAAKQDAVYKGLNGGVWKNIVSTDEGGRIWDMEGHNRDIHSFVAIHGNQIRLYGVWDNPNGPTLKLNPHLIGTHAGADTVTTFSSRQFMVNSAAGYAPAPCTDGSQPDMEISISQDGRTIRTIQRCGTTTRATATYNRIK